MRSVWILGCVVVATTASDWDFEDPQAEHTRAAIDFDRRGEHEKSRRAFEAATRFTPTTSTWVNLGVCLMRRASASASRRTKVEYYHGAARAMKSGEALAKSESDWSLHGENWAALMENYKIERIEMPDDVEDEPQMCGSVDRAALRREAEAERDRSRPHHREFLVHQRDAPIAPALPRVSVFELANEPRYFERRDPFVLEKATDGWFQAATPGQALDFLHNLARNWPAAVVDLYPYNMLSKARKSPYLTRLPRAVDELVIDDDKADAPSKFRRDPTAKRGRYAHLQLTPAMWRDLEAHGTLTVQRHPHLLNDAWLDTCLADDPTLLEEYHLKTHWKILLAGTAGAGMFNHSDSLQTSSWHAHLAGRKWWYVCGRLSDSPDPDAPPACFEAVLGPGDILYYGQGWHHETQNLETPTITLTDTAVHARNYRAVATTLHSECARATLNFKFSASLCDRLDNCYDSLQDLYGRDDHSPPLSLAPWRTLASADLIRSREATLPAHNNYDGRNFITE